MDDKSLQGIQLEDMIAQLEKHSIYCEEKSRNNADMERQRFYEGMAIAYRTMTVTLKNDFEPLDYHVIDALYDALEKTSKPNHTNETCSFCLKNKQQVGPFATGLNVAICGECIQFGADVIQVYSTEA